MCGIAGIYKINDDKVEIKEIKKMIGLLVHRGPDDEGVYINNNIGLGHRRLAIIDLSPLGHQPLTNKDKSLWITYNGEIYNYLELRKELEGLGYKFKSYSDTEVVLYAYQEWGKKCLNKFNGMWAFAVWDERKKSLFLSRDRMGIKPLYYYLDDKKFIFASEIKPILAVITKREPNDRLIYDFLKYGILDHTNETFFKNIKKIPAAHFAHINQSGKLSVEKYWDFYISNEIETKNKQQERFDVQEFLDIFTDSVKLRLRSDVPVGSCLSGGLDSSSIVVTIDKILKNTKGENISNCNNTFSSCFENKKFDERKYIKLVTQKTGFKKNYIFLEAQDFMNELHRFLWHQEEPFRGTSMYAQYKVFQKAKEQGVKVLLDGQGGDELLGGYRKFYIFYLRYLMEQKRYFKLVKELMFFFSPSIIKTSYFLAGLRYFDIGNKIQNIDKFFNKKFKDKFSGRKLNFAYNSKLGQRFKEDLTKWSLPVLLRYGDKNSSAHAIEERLPFLDHRLIEKVASLPLDQKIRNGWTKYILRKAMVDRLPRKIRLRKTKIGFVTPERIWFKKTIQKNVEDTFQNAKFIKNYINTDMLKKEFKKYTTNNNSLLSNDIFFRFFILELWGKMYFL